MPATNLAMGLQDKDMLSRFSLQQRLVTAFLGISLLVLLASGAGFIYSRSVSNAIRTTQDGIDQIQNINKLQNDWQNISEMVETLFLTRLVDQTAGSLQSRLSAFESQLNGWMQQPPGVRNDEIEKNRSLLVELEGNATSMHATIDEITRLAAEGRWAVARDLRETVYVQQQAELNAGLQSLAANLRGEVQSSVDQAERTQLFSRTVAIAATVSAFLIAILVSLGVTRSIVQPVKQLTEATQRVTLGDFSTITPQDRTDEIGKLSRSFALMTDWLRESYENLEARVSERTYDLERQSAQIQVAAEIARDISSSGNVHELLSRAAVLIVERFDFYHAGIFLLDELKQFAVLRAAAGPSSAELIARLHRLRVGEVGMVGFVAQTGIS
ncbi:MAG: HAMP domain-containing protein, partial [Anaerolineales bacterium]